MQKLALIGNPNTGKTSLFNLLTGLNQHVGNFAGVTVSKKTGVMKYEGRKIQVTDLPGTYSFYPHSADESIVHSILTDKSNPDFPEKLLFIIDAANLERNLLLFTQIYDLNIPMIAVLNMHDVATRQGIQIDTEAFKKHFPGVEIISTNARVGMGARLLKETIAGQEADTTLRKFIFPEEFEEDHSDSDVYTQKRFEYIRAVLSNIKKETPVRKSKVSLLDRIVTHKIGGYALFALVLILIFQLIFSIAEYPMNLIDYIFVEWGTWTSEHLPEGIFNDMVSNGIIPGLGGVLVFIPQIAILFFCLSILEETGYMSRVVFIMDRVMRPFGLNGKSVVPLMSSVACAIPGIMSARTIINRKERLITILVAPLMSCSARIPVYTLLIALVIPKMHVFSIFNLQGLVLFALYLLGIIAALLVAWVINLMTKSKGKSMLMLELPAYKLPRWGNVFITVFEKVKIFVLDSGKIIMAVSVILWALATFGPSGRMEKAVASIEIPKEATPELLEEYQQQTASAALENSYIGILGKAIEPAIQPLGYDWKIGIALLTSFAAREVFVGSLATIYSVEDDGAENLPLLTKMKTAKRADGSPVYSLATGLSLMVFYAFAMQCMATLAIVKTETNSWKWPLVQLFYMGIMAYLASYIVYTIFS